MYSLYFRILNRCPFNYYAVEFIKFSLVVVWSVLRSMVVWLWINLMWELWVGIWCLFLWIYYKLWKKFIVNISTKRAVKIWLTIYLALSTADSTVPLFPAHFASIQQHPTTKLLQLSLMQHQPMLQCMTNRKTRECCL